MSIKFVKFAKDRLPGISIAIIQSAWSRKCLGNMVHHLKGRDVTSTPMGEIVETRPNGDKWYWTFSRGQHVVWSAQRRDFI